MCRHRTGAGRLDCEGAAVSHDGNCPGRSSGGASGFGITLQPHQFGAHFSRALIAKIAIFLERPVDDVFQLGW